MGKGHKHRKHHHKHSSSSEVNIVIKECDNDVLIVPSAKCPLSDEYAKYIESLWKKVFPDASLLPVIGFPSYKNSGVLTITHSMPDMPKMSINGLISNSPLANNALFSSECKDGRYINLYEIMIPDVPGIRGNLSASEVYVNALRDNGLNVQGTHVHWFGSTVLPRDKGVTAVHHMTTSDMDPAEFTQRTIKALQTAMAALNR